MAPSSRLFDESSGARAGNWRHSERKSDRSVAMTTSGVLAASIALLSDSMKALASDFGVRRSISSSWSRTTMTFAPAASAPTGREWASAVTMASRNPPSFRRWASTSLTKPMLLSAVQSAWAKFRKGASPGVKGGM